MTKLNKPVARVSQTTLDGAFGTDRGRAVVVRLVPGDGKDIDDLIELRPAGTRRAEYVAITDVYRFALQCRANQEWARRMQERRQKKAERLARERLARAERRFTHRNRAAMEMAV